MLPCHSTTVECHPTFNSIVAPRQIKVLIRFDKSPDWQLEITLRSLNCDFRGRQADGRTFFLKAYWSVVCTTGNYLTEQETFSANGDVVHG